MTKRSYYARTSALPAIAAAMAFLSTPALAQQSQPTSTPTDTTTTPDAQSAPPTQTAPADQLAPASNGTIVPDASATDVTTPATSRAVATPKSRPMHASPAQGAATKTTVVQKTSHVTHSAAAPAPAKAPAPPAPAAAPVAAVPAVSLAKPATPAPAKRGNDTALELGGGALALLILGGGAYAMARRRRHEEQEQWYYDEPAADDVVEPAVAEARTEPELHAIEEPAPLEEQPAIVAPTASAFAWGKDAAAESHVQTADDDRRPGETWVERAYRGPSANNPSYSLRRRLKRAAFFDKREREAAQGRETAAANDSNETVAEATNELVPA